MYKWLLASKHVSVHFVAHRNDKLMEDLQSDIQRLLNQPCSPLPDDVQLDGGNSGGKSSSSKGRSKKKTQFTSELCSAVLSADNAAAGAIPVSVISAGAIPASSKELQAQGVTTPCLW